jgi:hypothetical protein
MRKGSRSSCSGRRQKRGTSDMHTSDMHTSDVHNYFKKSARDFEHDFFDHTPLQKQDPTNRTTNSYSKHLRFKRIKFLHLIINSI